MATAASPQGWSSRARATPAQGGLKDLGFWKGDQDTDFGISMKIAFLDETLFEP